MRRGKPEGGQGSDNIGGNPDRQRHRRPLLDELGHGREPVALPLHEAAAPAATSSYPTRNVTVQWCITSEALDAKNHAFGGTWGGEDSTFHHNLFACNTGRNPSIGMGGEFDFRNNVIFNWRHRTMDGGDETSLINVINNYYKPGPATNDDMRDVMVRIEQRDMYSPGNRMAAGGWYPRTPGRPGKWYVAGNYFDGNAEVTADNWEGMQGARGAGPRQHAVRRLAGQPGDGRSKRTRPCSPSAGATLPKRDAVDARVIEMRPHRQDDHRRRRRAAIPKKSAAIPSTRSTPPTCPPTPTTTACPTPGRASTTSTRPTRPTAPHDADDDGYTNVEEFLNGTDPQRAGRLPQPRQQRRHDQRVMSRSAMELTHGGTESTEGDCRSGRCDSDSVPSVPPW